MVAESAEPQGLPPPLELHPHIEHYIERSQYLLEHVKTVDIFQPCSLTVEVTNRPQQNRPHASGRRCAGQL